MSSTRTSATATAKEKKLTQRQLRKQANAKERRITFLIVGGLIVVIVVLGALKAAQEYGIL